MVLSNIGIGLDIGTSAVKMVALKGGRKIQLHRFGVNPLPVGAVQGGEIKDIAAVGTAIAELFAEQGLEPGQVVVALSGQAVTVRLIKIDLQNKADISDIIHKEAEKYISFPLNEVNLDYQVLREDKIRHQADVVLACAPKQVVAGHLEALKAASIKPRAMDIQSFALVRAAGLEDITATGNGSVALLDLGEETSDLIIIERGLPVFTRIIPIAGATLIKQLVDNMKVSFNEAEDLKISYGDALYNLDEVTDSKGYFVNLWVREGLKMLVSELKKSLEYFQMEQQHRGGIGELIVSGGGALLQNLPAYLNRELGLKVSLCEAPPQLVLASQFQEEFVGSLPIYNVALGLALREVAGS